eukprot:1254492-Amphidinium_carterae.2
MTSALVGLRRALSFGFDAFLEGETIVDSQFGNRWSVFTGMPEGDWCQIPPVLGGIVSFVAGGREAVAVFNVRKTFLSGDVQIHAKKGTYRVPCLAVQLDDMPKSVAKA